MSKQLYEQIDGQQRLLIIFVVMAATLMEVIDTTIINVALPHMQGALNTTPDAITWTLTSYMVASAIFMPLTGYLSDKFGRKQCLAYSIIGFTIASACCGASTSLNQIVFFRLMQGVFGAALVPLSQAIMTDIYPPNERSRGMAIWGIGVMVGPILGPTIGGYLTDFASWRWTFYVNIPVGILAYLLVNVVPDTEQKQRSMDWVGLTLISLAIGGLQLVLDRGNTDDWLASSLIQSSVFITIVCFIGFLVHQGSNPKNRVFDIAMFKDRNFSISCLLLCVVGLGLYGTMVIQPIMMEAYLHYPVLTTGLMLAPRGLSGMLSMIIIAQLNNRIDARYLIIFGVMMCTLGIWVGTNYSLSITSFWLIWPMMLQGFGMGMIFVPLSTLAFSTLPNHLRTEAAGLYSLIRTIGGSIGISIVITVFTRRSQVFWNQLAASITPYNPQVSNYLAPLHLTSHDALGINLLAKELANQASMLAFVNVYAFVAWAFILVLPLVFLFKKEPSQES